MALYKQFVHSFLCYDRSAWYIYLILSHMQVLKKMQNSAYKPTLPTTSTAMGLLHAARNDFPLKNYLDLRGTKIFLVAVSTELQQAELTADQSAVYFKRRTSQLISNTKELHI